MTAQEIAAILPYVLGGLFLLALALLLLALFHLRRGRTGPYWRLRRQASVLGGRLLLGSVALFALTVALAFYSGLAAVAFRGLDDLFAGRTAGAVGVVVPTLTPTIDPETIPTATPTEPPTRVPTSAAVSTPTATSLPPTLTPTATATLTPTITPTPPPPTETFTPSPTYEVVLNLAPPVSHISARSGAAVLINAVDDAISANRTPIQPRDVFAAGVRRLYFFISYRQMNDGVVWSRVLYRDDVPVQGQAYLWSLGEQGDSYFFFGNDSGYAPGRYEVRLYIGDREVNRIAFAIQESE